MTSILNVGQDMNELQNTTSNNTGVKEQYFEINHLSINPSKTLYSVSDKTTLAGK
jgi:hypothetical protein